MKKHIAFLLMAVLALLLSLAFACNNCNVSIGDGQSWATCKYKAKLQEEIKLSIPKRLALHLTETNWSLDLNDPPLGSVTAKEGCFLVPKGYQGTPKDLLEQLQAGELTPAGTYPAIVDINGDHQISNDEKGTLVCFNKKVLQKFCNTWQQGTAHGCEFDLKVNVIRPYPFQGSYGRLFFYDDVTLPPVGQVTVNPYVEVTPGNNDQGSPIEVLRVRGARFPGWLDDFITEGFWFDGSELPGEYEFNVIFMLTAI